MIVRHLAGYGIWFCQYVLIVRLSGVDAGDRSPATISARGERHGVTSNRVQDPFSARSGRPSARR